MTLNFKKINKRCLLIGIALVLVLVLGVAGYLLRSKKGWKEDVLGRDIVLYVYSINGNPTGRGVISVPFLKEAEERWLLNIAVDLNGDEELDLEKEWVVKDQTVRTRTDYRNNFTLSLVDSEVRAGSKLKAVVVLSREELGESWNGMVREKDQGGEVEVVVKGYEIGDLIGVDVEGARPELKRGPTGVFKVLSPSSVFAQNDLVEAFRESSVPDINQGEMECIPASTANNIISLAREHGLEERLPESTRDLIRELKKDMNFDNGVLARNIVPGKNVFVERHNLPIATEFVESPSAREIGEAIDRGCVVELSMTWIRSASGIPDTGHVVSVVGLTGNDGTQQVQVHDPATPEGLDTYDLPFEVEGGGVVYEGIDYPGWDGIAYVDGMVVECWTEAEAAATGQDDTSRVEMLVINNHYFPKHQFSASECGECDGLHWHARGPVYGLRTKTSTEIVSMTDPSPPLCGFGKVSEVPAENIDISFEQSSELIRYVVP